MMQDTGELRGQERFSGKRHGDTQISNYGLNIKLELADKKS